MFAAFHHAARSLSRVLLFRSSVYLSESDLSLLRMPLLTKRIPCT